MVQWTPQQSYTIDLLDVCALTQVLPSKYQTQEVKRIIEQSTAMQTFIDQIKAVKYQIIKLKYPTKANACQLLQTKVRNYKTREIID